jgi:hypothetical protein
MVEELEERMEVFLEEQKRNAEAVQGENRQQLLEERNSLQAFENEMKERIGSLPISSVVRCRLKTRAGFHSTPACQAERKDAISLGRCSQFESTT